MKQIVLFFALLFSLSMSAQRGYDKEIIGGKNTLVWIDTIRTEDGVIYNRTERQFENDTILTDYLNLQIEIMYERASQLEEQATELRKSADSLIKFSDLYIAVEQKRAVKPKKVLKKRKK